MLTLKNVQVAIGLHREKSRQMPCGTSQSSLQRPKTTGPTMLARCNGARMSRLIAVMALVAGLFMSAHTAAVAATLPEDAPESIRNDLRAAHNQDVNAMYNVASYLSEQRVSADDPLGKYAFGWALLAARNGHPQAAELTGVMYRTGLGVPQNFVKARKWLERALSRESLEPNFELALLYSDRNNTGNNPAKAAEYLTEAIKKREPRACLISARNKLEDGQTFRKVLNDVTCAAEGGVIDAMEMLGDYNISRKSPYATVRAREWLTRAVEAGSETAGEKLAQLEAQAE